MTPRFSWFRLGAAGAAAALALGLPLPGILESSLLALTLALTPGAVMAEWLAPAAGRATRALLALTLSPLLVAGPAAALLALGVPMEQAARVIAWAVAALAAISAWRHREPMAGEGKVVWGSALAWYAVVAALLLGNPALIARSDGWFHAAVTLQVHGHGLPLEDPFFAGLKLLYFWGMHVWAAMWLALVPATSVWTPLIALDLAAAVATMLAITLLARRLGGDARAQALAATLAVVGYAPFAWLLMVGRTLIGAVTGMQEVRQLLLRGVDPIMAAMNAQLLHSSMVFFGDKFLIATPFGMGLALFGAFVLTLLEAIERPSWRTWVLLALLQIASLFLHSVIGYANAIAAGGWWCWALWRATAGGDRRLKRVLVPLLLVFIVAAIVLLPYLRATTAAKRQSFHFGLDGPTVRTWLLAGLVFVPSGMGWLVARARRRGPAREVLGLALSLTLAALLLGLPLGNQSKLFGLLFLLLSAPAALGWQALIAAQHGARRVLLIAVLALATLPTAGLCLWGFATEHGQLDHGWDRRDSAAERDGWRWASANLPRDALFVDAAERLDMTVYAARSALWGGPGWAKNWGYDPAALELRHRATATLGRGAAPPSEVRAMLLALGRPVIVVARHADAADSTSPWARLALPDHEAARRAALTPIFANSGLALYRWQGQP